MANSGRLKDVLAPGRTVYLAKKGEPWRRTQYDLALVSLETGLVSVDARLPCDLVAEALAEGRLSPFTGYQSFKREVVFGDSRLDFRLEGSPDCLLEVKSVTKVGDGTAMFPDAVTARGKKHVGTLLEAKRQGFEAAVVWVVQREDAIRFSPDDETDPVFGEAVRQAMCQGLEAFAFKCHISLKEVRITEQIRVEL